MIKCDGFLKLLKLSCFGLLTSFFTLFVGSSASAVGYQLVGLTGYDSPTDSNYQITFLKGGGVLTNLLGTSKGILAFRNDVLFFWSINGYPYAYLKSDSRTDQGYFDRYFVCDLPQNFEVSNCSLGGNLDINDNSSKEIFVNFFKQVLPGDEILYDYVYNYYNGATWSYIKNYMYVCFGSQSVGKSLCFVGGACTNGVSCTLGGQNIGGLTSSLGFTNLSFGNISYNYFGPAPGQNGYGGQYEGSDGNSSQGTVDTTLTGATVFGECTVGYAKSVAENQGMSKYLCYGGLPIDSNGLALPVAGTGASVFEIFQASNDGQNFSDWFTYWNGVYTNRYVYDSSIWSGTPAPLYSYFNFVSQYGPQFEVKEIQDYCRIIVNNMSESQKWTGIQSWCPFQAGGGGGGGGGGAWDDDTGTGSSSSSSVGTVPIGVNWGGVGAISGNENKDALTFIQDFFNKAREIIPTDFSDIGGGFLPTYIITFLCAIILFRFLRH